MRREASDNVYLHKDFHGALSNGIDYLEQRYGDVAVREYLRRFTISFYTPLIEDVRSRGLVALKEYFEKIYAREGSRTEIELTNDELFLRVEACPAVTHMRKHGYKVARLFVETDRTVNAALCEQTDFEAELIEYDPETGRSVQRFVRRRS